MGVCVHGERVEHLRDVVQRRDREVTLGERLVARDAGALSLKQRALSLVQRAREAEVVPDGLQLLAVFGHEARPIPAQPVGLGDLRAGVVREHSSVAVHQVDEVVDGRVDVVLAPVDAVAGGLWVAVAALAAARLALRRVRLQR